MLFLAHHCSNLKALIVIVVDLINEYILNIFKGSKHLKAVFEKRGTLWLSFKTTWRFHGAAAPRLHPALEQTRHPPNPPPFLYPPLPPPAVNLPPTLLPPPSP